MLWIVGALAVWAVLSFLDWRASLRRAYYFKGLSRG